MEDALARGHWTRHWMPLYIPDYLADTGHLNAAEHGAYLLLIMHYWSTGKPLPNDDAILARIARMTMEEWSIAKALLKQCFSIDADTWRHGRVERELARAETRYRKRAEAGKKGGSAKKSPRHPPESNALAMLKQCRSNAEATTTTYIKPISLPSGECQPPLPLVIAEPENNFGGQHEDRPETNGDGPKALFDAWNEAAVKLPKALSLSSKREKHCRVRLKEYPLPWWQAVFKRMNATPMLAGTNDRGWRATFDWIVESPDNALKVMEGKYDQVFEQSPRGNKGDGMWGRPKKLN